jgi:UDP-N-acetylglucosamine 2-epimerase (non-hydrolysing)
VDLMQRAHLIIYRFGRAQEEGSSPGKPVLALRERTERPEAVEAGTVEELTVKNAIQVIFL